jgi:hypothetical protein
MNLVRRLQFTIGAPLGPEHGETLVLTGTLDGLLELRKAIDSALNGNGEPGIITRERTGAEIFVRRIDATTHWKTL